MNLTCLVPLVVVVGVEMVLEMAQFPLLYSSSSVEAQLEAWLEASLISVLALVSV